MIGDLMLACNSQQNNAFQYEQDPFSDNSQLSLYPFNEDTSDVLGLHTFTLENGAILDNNFGKIEGSLKTSPTGRSSVATLTTLSLENVTHYASNVSSWWYVDENNSTYRHFISHAHTGNYYTFSFMLYNGYLYFRYRTTSTGTISLRQITLLPLNEWFKLGWYRSSSNQWIVCLNGVQVDTFNIAPYSDPSYRIVKLHGWETNEPLNGYHDQYRVFNRNLTEEEDLYLYNMEKDLH